MIARIAFAAVLAQLLCVGLTSATNVTSKPDGSATTPPQLGPTPGSTVAPVIPTTPPPPPSPPTTKPTIPPPPTTKPSTTTKGPDTTTSTTSKPDTSTTPIPSSSTPITTTSPTTPPPSPKPADRKFDAYSFLGGFALCLGLVAIGFLSWKFYISRQENFYHTL